MEPRPRPGETTNVWIPAGTADRHIAVLPDGVTLHVLPTDDSDHKPLGPGQFVVAGFQREHLPEAMRHLEDVRVVQAMSAGIEDLIGNIPDGAVLCDGAGIHDVPVAEWVIMVMLAMYRELPQQVMTQREGRWKRPRLGTMSDLEGTNVLIVGYGAIGRALEARILPFGVNITRTGRRARPGVSAAAQLPSLLPQADVVVILLPLTPETQGFVNADFISRMKTGSLLINPSRGRVVDTPALMQALKDHRIRAALDVTDPEPLPDGHELWKLDGVLITPHTAGPVSAMIDRAWNLVARQLRKYLNGEPLDNVVADGY